MCGTGKVLWRSVRVCVGGAECFDDAEVCTNSLDLGETDCSSADHTMSKDGSICVDDKCVVSVDYSATDCSFDNHVYEHSMNARY